jgi:1-acyl-sn-glycerol-3-phosphate acyltransferase
MDHRIYRNPLLGFFFRTVRAIPIASAKDDPDALKSAYDAIAAALADGDLVGLFPEGKLTADGEMNEFRPGISQIIERTPVPVIPMALSGLWETVFARNPERVRQVRRLLFAKIGLAIGGPVAPAAATPEHLHSIVLGLRGNER